jgi:hypothetical protein
LQIDLQIQMGGILDNELFDNLNNGSLKEYTNLVIDSVLNFMQLFDTLSKTLIFINLQLKEYLIKIHIFLVFF